MAHRNLSPELLTIIQTYGTLVADGYVMLHSDIAGAIRPLQDHVRQLRRIVASHGKKRGMRPPLAPHIQEVQLEIADSLRRIDAIRKTEGFLVCVVDGFWVITVQRLQPKKLQRALRGSARAHQPSRRQQEDQRADPARHHSPRRPDRMKAHPKVR
jgi:hypothetical protein